MTRRLTWWLSQSSSDHTPSKITYTWIWPLICFGLNLGAIRLPGSRLKAPMTCAHGGWSPSIKESSLVISRLFLLMAALKDVNLSARTKTKMWEVGSSLVVSEITAYNIKIKISIIKPLCLPKFHFSQLLHWKLNKFSRSVAMTT